MLALLLTEGVVLEFRDDAIAEVARGEPTWFSVLWISDVTITVHPQSGEA